MRATLPLLLAVIAAAGCRTTGVLVADTAGVDTAVDGGTDSGTDAGTDVGTGTAPDTGGTQEGFGGTVGTPDTGSGAAAGAYRVDAHVWAADTFLGATRFISSSMEVRLWNAAGQPLSGATVQLGTFNFGDTTLVEDLPGNPGTYLGEQFGYDQTYVLHVEGPAGVFEAAAVGPATHTIDVGPAPVDRASEWVIGWSPAGADFARIDTNGDGQRNIDDTGSYTIGAGRADYRLAQTGEERVRLTRWNVLALDGAAPNSAFQVSVRMTEEPVDVVDSRTGEVNGALDIDRNLVNDRADAGDPPYAGTMIVLAWPRALDPYDTAAWSWTSVADWPNNTDYRLTGLAPGEWHLLAYLDVDNSDAGASKPAGPSQNEPFRERDLTIDPNGNHNRDLTLRDLW